ncbi:uncharacterized protein LOC141994891 isoform X2 [Natator depressus]|uniref:uncharacterized protein LOC141994891 isoform X2 n=1 Tax=Natator depressus TaxID=27790 RepID=UPI003EBF8A3A
MRLISSASKLIVAATCEISSEEIKKPDCASPQKRKEDKNIQRLDHYCKQRTPPLVISPDPHEYDAKSTRETNKLEESNADFIQEDSGNDYGKSGVHHSQNNTCNSLHQRTQSNQRQKKKEDLCELATGKNTKSHKVCFQGPLQFSRNTEQKCKCVNLNSCNITSEYGIQTIASESKSLETMTHLPENEKEEHLSRVTLGAPSFLHQVFLEMEQDASPTSTASEPKDLDSSLENKNIQQLSNQLFILNESTGDKKVQDAISNVHTRDIILTDPCDWQMAHIPQKAQCCCTCAEQQRNFISETSDEEQDSFSDSSVTVTSILGASENEQSEEFIVSSVSDSLSLRSLSDVHEQMALPLVQETGRLPTHTRGAQPAQGPRRRHPAAEAAARAEPSVSQPSSSALTEMGGNSGI